MSRWTRNAAGELDAMVWRDTDAPDGGDDGDGWQWTCITGPWWSGFFRPTASHLPANVPPMERDDLDDLADTIDGAAARWGVRLRLAVGPGLRSPGYALGLWRPNPAPGWIMISLGQESTPDHVLDHELHHAAAHHRHLWRPGEWDAVTAYGKRVRASASGWLQDPGEAEGEAYACLRSRKPWPGGIDPRKGFPAAVAAWRRLAGA